MVSSEHCVFCASCPATLSAHSMCRALLAGCHRRELRCPVSSQPPGERMLLRLRQPLLSVTQPSLGFVPASMPSPQTGSAPKDLLPISLAQATCRLAPSRDAGSGEGFGGLSAASSPTSHRVSPRAAETMGGVSSSVQAVAALPYPLPKKRQPQRLWESIV